MNWVTADIAIGNYLEAQDPDLLRAHSIASILGLIRTLEGKEPRELGLQAIEISPLEDGWGNEPAIFLGAVESLRRMVEGSPPVLVHCFLGRSRSPVVVAGYLKRTLGISSTQAIERVAAARTDISISKGLLPLLDIIEPA